MAFLAGSSSSTTYIPNPVAPLHQAPITHRVSDSLTDAQIYEKAIKKAVKQGWDNGTYEWDTLKPEDFEYQVSSKVAYRFLYDHSFAESFWGDQNTPVPAPTPTVKYSGISTVVFSSTATISYAPLSSSPIGGITGGLDPTWKIHLRAMVGLENPYSYLEKFI